MSQHTKQALHRFDLKTLYETSQLLSSSLDLDFVLGNLLLIVMSKLLVMRGLVLLHEPVTDTYRVVAVKGMPDVEKNTELALDGSLDEEMYRDDEVPLALARHRIALMLPIVYRDRQIGFIGLGRKANGEPCEGPELEFLKSLVNMSSAAVHNSLMVEQLQTANRDLDSKIQELNTLFDLSQEFNATLDRKRLLKLLSFALMGQLLVQRHVFLLRGTQEEDDPKAFRVVAAQAIPNTDFSDELCNRLREQKDLVMIQDGEEGPEWDELKARGIQLILPLNFRGETKGVLCLGPKMTGQPYQPTDIEFLYALGNLAVTSIQNSYLVEEQIEKERLEEEMRLARDIQERLLPQKIPSFIGLDIAAYARPSRHVAGDYFDIVRVGEERLLVAIADVTGKGVPASLLMANIQACLRMVSPIDMTLEEATSRINRVIYDNTGYDKFITFFWGLYAAGEQTFNYINAGHDPPMLFSKAGEVKRLEQGGLLLGVFEAATYERGVETLHEGDVLVMYTDGVNEAMDPEENQYGEDRMQEVVQVYRHAPAQAILDALLDDVRRFTKGAPQSDDLTVIVLKAA